MIELELNEKHYKLPTSFSEVNIEVYSKVVALDKDLKPLDKYVKIISILTGLDEEVVRQIKMEQINLIGNNIKFMFDTSKAPLIDRFELDGVKYGFNYDLDNISFGEFIDLEDFSNPEEVNNNLHILMSILYRPIKKFPKKSLIDYLRKPNEAKFKIEEYDGTKVMERAELFKNKLMMDKVLGSVLFFSILNAAIILNTQGYSGKKLTNKLIEMMKNQNLIEVDGLK